MKRPSEKKTNMMGDIRDGSRKAGLPPGSLIHVGRKHAEKVRIDIMDYDQGRLEEISDLSVADCLPYRDRPTVTWMNVTGIHDVDVIRQIGDAFHIHPLILEDIVHTGQRPKIEDLGDYLYIVLKMLTVDDSRKGFLTEQVSLILNPHVVISFQEREGDVFDAVRNRIREGQGVIRKAGSDYLAYRLIDAVVDNYFIVLEMLGEKIEALQEGVLAQPGPETLQEIHVSKGEMIFLRRAAWPLREAVGSLERGESTLISAVVRPYLRDVYDHVIQIIDTVETLRDILSGTLDIYLSSVSNRMNEVMKVLTIIATIFIPLTFIVGVYGMNFKYMPELEWKWGYLAIWIVIVGVACLMLVCFRRKKWL